MQLLAGERLSDDIDQLPVTFPNHPAHHHVKSHRFVALCRGKWVEVMEKRRSMAIRRAAEPKQVAAKLILSLLGTYDRPPHQYGRYVRKIGHKFRIIHIKSIQRRMTDSGLRRDEPVTDRGWPGAATGSASTCGGFEVGQGNLGTMSRKHTGNYIAANKILSTADPPLSSASSLTSVCLMLFTS